MTYMERRIRLADTMAHAAAIIRQEPDPVLRARLVENAADELHDCLENGSSYHPGVLADCFVESVERWLKVVEPQSLDANRVPQLRLVEP